MSTYQENLQTAIEYAKNLISKGASWHVATESANEEFGVSLCDIQENVANPNS